MVIDDDMRIRDVLKELLLLDGHDVTVESDGMDGIEVGRRIKITSPRTRLVLLTGWGAQMKKEDTPEYVDELLSKPVTLESLRDALSKTL